MSNRKVAFSMLLLLFCTGCSSNHSCGCNVGRNSPDFNVSVMTFSSGGSIDDAGQIKLAPGDHILRVVVTNNGGAGSAILNIVHRASASSGETPVTSIDLGTIGGASSSNPVLINWTASSGDGQTLYARVVSVADTDTSNNERPINFDVTMYHGEQFWDTTYRGQHQDLLT